MRTLYLDCGMGAAGDMLTAALLMLADDREGFLRRINAALGGMAAVSCAPDSKCGVQGLHVTVSVGGDVEGKEPRHPHEHTSIGEIRALIAAAPVSEWVRADALAVFDSLAAAEAAVHGQDMENIHFHELGSIDAVADVLGVCLLMEALAPERVVCSPVNVGGGTVKCAHGVLPVPAPATERLLRGVPYYEGEIKTELCTPTGATLLRHFVDRFGDMPQMIVQNTGYGTGTKDFGRLNAVRAVLGEAEGETESLVELACNLDDMTGEELGFAAEELFAAGALDVWTTPIGMKKGRPAVLIPSPYVAENHQYHNAMSMVNKRAAMLIEEKDLPEGGNVLAREVLALAEDPRRLTAMADCAKRIGRTNAADMICDSIGL